MKQLYSLALLFSAIATAQVSVNFGNSVCAPGDCTTVYAQYADANETTSYMVQAVPYNPQPYGQGYLIPIETDDSWSPPISLDFLFSFYGTLYSQVQIGANGVLAFTNTDDSCPWGYSAQIPNAEFPIKNAIYGVYQDLDMLAITDPETQNISYYFIGVAPFRALVVNFNQLPLYQCGDSVGLQTSQIVLHETTNEIEISVANRTPCNTWQNGVGLIGIQNASGTSAVAPPGRNTGSWSATNETWKFIPTGGSTASLEWFLNGVLIDETAPVITVCPEENATYSAQVTYVNNGNPITYSDEITIPVGTGLEENPDPSDLYACSDNGMGQFDLTMALPTFLDGEPLENFEIGFFATQADAENFANPISFPESFIAPDGTIVYLAAESLLSISGCFEVRPFTLHIGDGLPAGESIQFFDEGETLDDLDVAGNTITWYDMPQGGNLLPGTTLLVNNTTYYAQSSPVPGCDGARGTIQRLAVTVFDESLDTAEFNLNAVKVAPNPVENQLTIAGIKLGYTIEVTNLLGQKISSLIPTDSVLTIDTGSWTPGTYLIRIWDASSSRTIKVVKS